MAWFKELREEMRARRAGRKHLTKNIAKATRDIAGPTGWVVSRTWDKVDQDGDAYVDSFDRRLPPSIFVSERDRKRANQPMPVVERCIEDWGKDPSEVMPPIPTQEPDDAHPDRDRRND